MTTTTGVSSNEIAFIAFRAELELLAERSEKQVNVLYSTRADLNEKFYS